MFPISSLVLLYPSYPVPLQDAEADNYYLSTQVAQPNIAFKLAPSFTGTTFSIMSSGATASFVESDDLSAASPLVAADGAESEFSEYDYDDAPPEEDEEELESNRSRESHKPHGSPIHITSVVVSPKSPPSTSPPLAYAHESLESDPALLDIDQAQSNRYDQVDVVGQVLAEASPQQDEMKQSAETELTATALQCSFDHAHLIATHSTVSAAASSTKVNSSTAGATPDSNAMIKIVPYRSRTNAVDPFPSEPAFSDSLLSDEFEPELLKNAELALASSNTLDVVASAVTPSSVSSITLASRQPKLQIPLRPVARPPRQAVLVREEPIPEHVHISSAASLPRSTSPARHRTLSPGAEEDNYLQAQERVAMRRIEDMERRRAVLVNGLALQQQAAHAKTWALWRTQNNVTQSLTQKFHALAQRLNKINQSKAEIARQLYREVFLDASHDKQVRNANQLKARLEHQALNEARLSAANERRKQLDEKKHEEQEKALQQSTKKVEADAAKRRMEVTERVSRRLHGVKVARDEKVKEDAKKFDKLQSEYLAAQNEFLKKEVKVHKKLEAQKSEAEQKRRNKLLPGSAPVESLLPGTSKLALRDILLHADQDQKDDATHQVAATDNHDAFFNAKSFNSLFTIPSATPDPSAPKSPAPPTQTSPPAAHQSELWYQPVEAGPLRRDLALLFDVKPTAVGAPISSSQDRVDSIEDRTYILPRDAPSAKPSLDLEDDATREQLALAQKLKAAMEEARLNVINSKLAVQQAHQQSKLQSAVNEEKQSTCLSSTKSPMKKTRGKVLRAGAISNHMDVFQLAEEQRRAVAETTSMFYNSVQPANTLPRSSSPKKSRGAKTAAKPGETDTKSTKSPPPPAPRTLSPTQENSSRPAVVESEAAEVVSAPSLPSSPIVVPTAVLPPTNPSFSSPSLSVSSLKSSSSSSSSAVDPDIASLSLVLSSQNIPHEERTLEKVQQAQSSVDHLNIVKQTLPSAVMQTEADKKKEAEKIRRDRHVLEEASRVLKDPRLKSAAPPTHSSGQDPLDSTTSSSANPSLASLFASSNIDEWLAYIHHDRRERAKQFQDELRAREKRKHQQLAAQFKQYKQTQHAKEEGLTMAIVKSRNSLTKIDAAAFATGIKISSPVALLSPIPSHSTAVFNFSPQTPPTNSLTVLDATLVSGLSLDQQSQIAAARSPLHSLAPIARPLSSPALNADDPAETVPVPQFSIAAQQVFGSTRGAHVTLASKRLGLNQSPALARQEELDKKRARSPPRVQSAVGDRDARSAHSRSRSNSRERSRSRSVSPDRLISPDRHRRDVISVGQTGATTTGLLFQHPRADSNPTQANDGEELLGGEVEYRPDSSSTVIFKTQDNPRGVNPLSPPSPHQSTQSRGRSRSPFRPVLNSETQAKAVGQTTPFIASVSVGPPSSVELPSIAKQTGGARKRTVAVPVPARLVVNTIVANSKNAPISPSGPVIAVLRDQPLIMESRSEWIKKHKKKTYTTTTKKKDALLHEVAASLLPQHHTDAAASYVPSSAASAAQMALERSEHRDADILQQLLSPEKYSLPLSPQSSLPHDTSQLNHSVSFPHLHNTSAPTSSLSSPTAAISPAPNRTALLHANLDSEIHSPSPAASSAAAFSPASYHQPLARQQLSTLSSMISSPSAPSLISSVSPARSKQRDPIQLIIGQGQTHNKIYSTHSQAQPVGSFASLRTEEKDDNSSQFHSATHPLYGDALLPSSAAGFANKPAQPSAALPIPRLVPPPHIKSQISDLLKSRDNNSNIMHASATIGSLPVNPLSSVHQPTQIALNHQAGKK